MTLRMTRPPSCLRNLHTNLTHPLKGATPSIVGTVRTQKRFLEPPGPRTQKHSQHGGSRIAPADREMISRYLASVSGLSETTRARGNTNCQRVLLVLSTEGVNLVRSVWTLDMLSIHVHSEGYPDANSFRFESGLEAKIQDILHDPAVLEYKRKLDNLWSA